MLTTLNNMTLFNGVRGTTKDFMNKTAALCWERTRPDCPNAAFNNMVNIIWDSVLTSRIHRCKDTNIPSKS